MKRQFYKLPLFIIFMNLFYNINDLEKKELLKDINVIKKEYFRGECILEEEGLCNSIAIVRRGKINAIKYYSDGHGKIIRTLEQNDCIGLNLIFSSNPFYKASFYAESLVTIELITKEDLYKLMLKSKVILSNILEAISNSSIELNDHIKLLAYKTIRERLAYYLYSVYEAKHELTFVIPYTKTELADYINVERPSLSNELSKLINEGIIANKNKLYTILDLNRLKSIL